jgi:RNA polymerase sigma-70 factor (ECF subfamily)
MCAAVPSLVPEPPDSPHSDDAARRGLCLVPASPVPEGAVYETTVLPHAAFLHARALGMTRNREEAEDLVQDTLLKALRHFRQFRPGTNSRAWLMRILKNTFISRWRSRGGAEPRVMTPLEDAPELIAVSTVSNPVDPEKALAQREGAVAVEKVFAAIPERYRSALRLHFLGLSYREIAERLDVPMGTVMSRLHRARRHATRVLRESGEKLGLRADSFVRA